MLLKSANKWIENAYRQEVSRSQTKGESVEKKYAGKGNPEFEAQSRCHQKSKIGLSVVPQKRLMSSLKTQNKTKSVSVHR